MAQRSARPGRSTRWPPATPKPGNSIAPASKRPPRLATASPSRPTAACRPATRFAWKSTQPTRLPLPPRRRAATPGKLTVTIADQADPIRVGGDTIYQIVLTNAGSTPQQQVVLSVKISEELRLIGHPDQPRRWPPFPASSPLQAGGRDPAGRIDHVRAADPGR